MKLRLVIEIDAMRPKDARDLAGVIDDYAEEQFEVITMDRGRPMSLRSWRERQDSKGKFR